MVPASRIMWRRSSFSDSLESTMTPRSFTPKEEKNITSMLKQAAVAMAICPPTAPELKVTSPPRQ